MVISKGDRFWSDKFQDYGTVVKYVSFKEWYFMLDGDPTTVYRAKFSPNKVKWVSVASNYTR